MEMPCFWIYRACCIGLIQIRNFTLRLEGAGVELKKKKEQKTPTPKFHSDYLHETARLHYSRETELYFKLLSFPSPTPCKSWVLEIPEVRVSWHWRSSLLGLCSLWKIPDVSTWEFFRLAWKELLFFSALQDRSLPHHSTVRIINPPYIWNRYIWPY